MLAGPSGVALIVNAEVKQDKRSRMNLHPSGDITRICAKTIFDGLYYGKVYYGPQDGLDGCFR